MIRQTDKEFDNDGYEIVFRFRIRLIKYTMAHCVLDSLEIGHYLL